LAKKEKLKTKKRYKESDFPLLVLTLVLSIFGIVMAFSASYYSALSKFGNPYRFLRDNMMWFILGWAALIFFSYFDYHRLRYVSLIALAAGLVLLMLIFTPMGITLNNATRWLDFKLFTVMPGEVIKFSLILFVAAFYSVDGNRIRTFRGIWPVALVTLVVILLIYKQPNLSTAGIIGLMVVGMMFVAGLSKVIFLGGLLAGADMFVVAIMLPQGQYMMQRVQTAMDPFADPLGSGYQVVQSLLAQGSGGITGVGLGQSMQKTLYLPEPQNDFILAIIGEELGLAGVIVLMLLFLLLIWRCCKVAVRAQDSFGMLLASGVAILLALQVILNIAVVSASFFPTGVFLPFISQGGNATLIFLSLMGIVINVSRQRDDAPFEEAGEAEL
jgi:cell division protein FtsW